MIPFDTQNSVTVEGDDYEYEWLGQELVIKWKSGAGSIDLPALTTARLLVVGGGGAGGSNKNDTRTTTLPGGGGDGGGEVIELENKGRAREIRAFSLPTPGA